ncbi:K(+)-insensitive pyrophosphate-energized proton pump [Carbonactinospora thermoautotrophica]|uniref:K(+)-insensitive pyrophosphate-energized proton pump n=1 Tax=Carbonactinospora thermoautotrophica TaxID=1469144 RepID=A0A132MM74_9ACTN|nr:K(+)-insensitive pyrophosphate-energized proton pump [Carbonactinospora thermoautotrophica]
MVKPGHSSSSSLTWAYAPARATARAAATAYELRVTYPQVHAASANADAL